MLGGTCESEVRSVVLRGAAKLELQYVYGDSGREIGALVLRTLPVIGAFSAKGGAHRFLTLERDDAWARRHLHILQVFVANVKSNSNRLFNGVSCHIVDHLWPMKMV